MSCAAAWSPHSSALGRRGGMPRSSSSSVRPRATAGNHQQQEAPRLVLHDSLDAAGVDTAHARAAREGFAVQVGRLNRVSAGASISISRGADLARAALCVAAEDDSLVSHSSVPLAVEAFISRLDDLSSGFCADGNFPPYRAPPEVFFDYLDRYLYVRKGFRRTNAVSDVRAIYLHSACYRLCLPSLNDVSNLLFYETMTHLVFFVLLNVQVLTCRSGSALMLALIYSEILKTVRIYGLLNFDAEISFPTDLVGLPRGYDKQKSKLGDEPHIMTAKSFLVEVLRTLKSTFWPFRSNQSSSFFLNAVAANHHGPGTVGDNQMESDGNISIIEMAAAKAAQHRLMRGVRTNVRFGDMRRALAACERLILLQHNPHELRDYAALLYHCGHYEECLHYLSSYETAMAGQSLINQLEILEDEAVNTLRTRVTLILSEDGWSGRRPAACYWTKNSEPW